jgi:hypothetical protein
MAPPSGNALEVSRNGPGADAPGLVDAAELVVVGIGLTSVVGAGLGAVPGAVGLAGTALALGAPVDPAPAEQAARAIEASRALARGTAWRMATRP